PTQGPAQAPLSRPRVLSRPCLPQAGRSAQRGEVVERSCPPESAGLARTLPTRLCLSQARPRGQSEAVDGFRPAAETKRERREPDQDGMRGKTSAGSTRGRAGYLRPAVRSRQSREA